MPAIEYKNRLYETYKLDIHSQNGEDGVIAEILMRLGIHGDAWICEFGAWDGKHLSNTFALLEDAVADTAPFKAIYIEGDPEKYKALLKTAAEFPAIRPVLAYVDAGAGPNSLDRILERAGVQPTDAFAILSIDVDGPDYHIWRDMTGFRPAVVVIEIDSGVNPSDPNIVDGRGRTGTGFQPMLALATEKGYRFVCHTGNMIFVRADLFETLKLEAFEPLENFKQEWYKLT